MSLPAADLLVAWDALMMALDEWSCREGEAVVAELLNGGFCTGADCLPASTGPLDCRRKA